MLYHVVAVNERTGHVTIVTGYPMPHHEACIVLRKFSHHPLRHMQLQQA